MDGIDRAFVEVDRVNFLPEDLRGLAYVDGPLPIGFGQTNSQPLTVKLMLKWLDAQPGEKVLDVGSGSGWTSALLSVLTMPNGEVFATERIPELLTMSKDNCKKAGFGTINFFLAGKEYGLPAYGPFDRILVSASAKKLLPELIEQLSVQGKLVIPVRHDILEITKTSPDDYLVKKHPGFAFVPLI